MMEAWKGPLAPYLQLLEQALHDAKQHIPGHSLQLPPVLLGESGHRQDDLI